MLKIWGGIVPEKLFAVILKKDNLDNWPSSGGMLPCKLLYPRRI